MLVLWQHSWQNKKIRLTLELLACDPLVEEHQEYKGTFYVKIWVLKDTTSWINTNLFFYFLEDGSVGGRDGDTLSWPIRSYPAGFSSGKSSERSNIY